MVALVRLIFIHIFMIFIGLANFGSPFKAGSGPNVQLMKLTTTRTLNIQDLQCTATTKIRHTTTSWQQQWRRSLSKRRHATSLYFKIWQWLCYTLHQEDYVEPEKGWKSNDPTKALHRLLCGVILKELRRCYSKTKWRYALFGYQTDILLKTRGLAALLEELTTRCRDWQHYWRSWLHGEGSSTNPCVEAVDGAKGVRISTSWWEH